MTFVAVILCAALAVCGYLAMHGWELWCRNHPVPLGTEAKGHPKDDALITNFNAHRNGFESLLKMFREDTALGRVAMDFTRPKNPAEAKVSPARIEEYRKRFGQLQLASGIEGYEAKDEIWFHASALGLSVTGTSKGYAYLKAKPELVAENLDEYKPPLRMGSHVVFRHLEGNWYLYYDITY